MFSLETRATPFAGLSLTSKVCTSAHLWDMTNVDFFGFSWTTVYSSTTCGPLGQDSAHTGGSFILRLFHHIAWLRRCMFLFVDDYFGFQRLDLPLTVTLLALTCQALSIPISWRKCELGCTVTWTGWKWHIFTGQLELHVEKFEKLRPLITQLLAKPKVSKQLLERFLGLAMWLTHLRAWSHPFYTDVHAFRPLIFLWIRASGLSFAQTDK